MDFNLNQRPLLKGVCAPLPLPLDEAGAFDAASQERLLAWVTASGAGVHAVFSAPGLACEGALRDQVHAATHFAQPKAEHWAGVSSRSVQGLLSNLEQALKLGVDMAVLDPQAVEDAPDSQALFHRHILPHFEKLGKGLPILIEDSGAGRRIRTRDLKQLARLDLLRGVCVTAAPQVVGNYLKGARHYKARHEFGVFLGNADLIFSLFKVHQGPLGGLQERWQRLWLGTERPHGIAPLSANLFPRAWRQAWAAALSGDTQRMQAFDEAFQGLLFPYDPLACVRAALVEEGVFSTDQALPGAPRLDDTQKMEWLFKYLGVKKELARLLSDPAPQTLPLASPAPSAAPKYGAEFMRRAVGELQKFISRLSPQGLGQARQLILEAEAQGKRLHVTGVGKPEYVAGYIASSFSSTGTPAFFLHATEAGHGASGQVAAGDVVIAISNSGETEELKAAVSTLKKNGARVIGVSGKSGSWLARQSDVFLFAGVEQEGDSLNLAPRASVLAEMLLLSALGVELQQQKNFSAEEFRSFHPGGALGRSN